MADNDVDIQALLSMAFNEEPSDDLPDRVMARIAAIETALEFARLFGLAPLSGLMARDDDDDDDNSGAAGPRSREDDDDA